MAASFRQTKYVPYDFAAANKYFSENKFPTPDPLPGDRSRTGIVCCSDPRCAPETFFKLQFQEAFCVRNEGGRAADPSVVRTILLIDSLGSTVANREHIHEVKVVHHTDCSALIYNDQSLLDIITKNDPDAPGGPWKKGAGAYAEAIASLPFSAGDTERERLEKTVNDDVTFLRTHPLWKKKIPVTGWIYDLKTGMVEKITA